MLNWVKLKPFLPLKTRNKPYMINFYRFKVVQNSSAIAKNRMQPSPQLHSRKRYHSVKGSTNLCCALSQLSWSVVKCRLSPTMNCSRNHPKLLWIVLRRQTMNFCRANKDPTQNGTDSPCYFCGRSVLSPSTCTFAWRKGLFLYVRNCQVINENCFRQRLITYHGEYWEFVKAISKPSMCLPRRNWSMTSSTLSCVFFTIGAKRGLSCTLASFVYSVVFMTVVVVLVQWGLEL